MPAIGWRGRAAGTGVSAGSPQARCSGTRPTRRTSWRWSGRGRAGDRGRRPRISEVGPGELVGEAAAFVVGEKRTAAVRAPARRASSCRRRGWRRCARRDAGGIRPAAGARCWCPRGGSKRRSRDCARGRRGPAARVRRASPDASTRAHPAVGAEVPARRVRRCACCPVLRGRARRRIAAIQAAMVPERVPEGDALIVEGDAGRSAVRAGRGAPGGVPPRAAAPACG